MPRTSYSSVNPRDEAQLRRHPQYPRYPSRDYTVLEAQSFNDFFDTKYQYDLDYIDYNPDNRSFTIQHVSRTTATAALDPRILPFKLPKPSTGDKRQQLIRNNARSFQLYGAITRDYHNPLGNLQLYRITSTEVCDQLGRHYQRASDGKYRIHLTTGYPDLRPEVTCKGNGTSISAYTYKWNAIAGFPRSTQSRLFFSRQYDYHHVAENRVDIRPDRILAIPTALHRYAHSNQPDPQDKVNFFK